VPHMMHISPLGIVLQQDASVTTSALRPACRPLFLEQPLFRAASLLSEMAMACGHEHVTSC
jgi:hypothetical protein